MWNLCGTSDPSNVSMRSPSMSNQGVCLVSILTVFWDSACCSTLMLMIVWCPIWLLLPVGSCSVYLSVEASFACGASSPSTLPTPKNLWRRARQSGCYLAGSRRPPSPPNSNSEYTCKNGRASSSMLFDMAIPYIQYSASTNIKPFGHIPDSPPSECPWTKSNSQE